MYSSRTIGVTYKQKMRRTSRGRVCVLAGGTVAHPQLMRRWAVEGGRDGYVLSLLA